MFLKEKDQLTIRLMIWIIDPKQTVPMSDPGKGKEESIGKDNSNEKLPEAWPTAFRLAVTKYHRLDAL